MPRVPLGCTKERKVIMKQWAKREEQIERVTGYGDTHPVKGLTRESPGNERITIYLTLTAPTKLKDRTLVDKPVPVIESPKEAHTGS